MTSSAWLQADGSGGGYRPYFNMSSVNHTVGQVRYHGKLQQLQVWDGNVWIGINNNVANINTSQAANEVMIWAQQKMREEQHLQALLNQYPDLRDLQEKFELMKILCQSEEANKHAG